MLFASVDQLEFKRTTRRDDLISLSYLLLFLLNNCEFPCLPNEFYKQKKNEQVFEKFNMMKKFKKETALSQMIKSLRPITHKKPTQLTLTEKSVNQSFQKQLESLLNKFVSRIEALKFDEKPNYIKLSNILIQCQQVIGEISRVEEICQEMQQNEKNGHKN